MKRFGPALMAIAFSASLFAAGSASAATFSANPASLGAIADGTGGVPGSYGAARDVTFTVAGFDAVHPSNIAVTLTLNHSFVGDLDAVLIAPDGTQKTIFSRTGATTAPAAGDNSDLNGTYTFSDRAPASPSWWAAAAALAAEGTMPSDSYRASLPGGAGGTGAATTIAPAFAAIPTTNGTWTLRLRDGTASDAGSVTAASLDITASVVADPSSLGTIPDGNAGYGAPLNVTFPISSFPAAAPGSVAVSMTLTHTYVGDLDAVLIAPDGTQATVFSRTGATSPSDFGNSSNLGGTYRFFDSALGSWWGAASTAGNNDVIPPSNYKPSTPGEAPSGGAAASLITPFSGLSTSNGTWTLRLRDHGGGDVGTVAAATLNVVPGTDVTAPAAPSFVGSSPPSPGNSTTPALKGTAEAGSTIRIFGDGFCSGSPAGIPAAIGSAAQFAGVGIPVPTSGDGTKVFSAVAYDRAGNVSGCTVTSFNYILDTAPPATPVFAGTDPPSPSASNLPKFNGSAEAGSTVSFWATASCDGPPAGTGPASAFTGSGVELQVPLNQVTTLWATAADAAGNVSSCSAPITYTHDSISAPPALSGTDPASPSVNSAPKVKGSAEAGATVRLYATADCTGSPLATGTAADLAGAGIGVTVPLNTTTAIRATATDLASNLSACSAPVTYVHDTSSPAAPSLSGTDPGSSANQNSPRIRGSAEAGSQVRLFTTADCSGAPAATGDASALGAGGIAVGVADDSTTQVRATATDGAGNASTCSPPISYTEDSAAPQTTAKAAKAKVATGARKAKIKFRITSSEAGSSLMCSLDNKKFASCGATASYTVKLGKHTLRAVATDAAANADASPAKATVRVVKRKKHK